MRVACSSVTATGATGAIATVEVGAGAAAIVLWHPVSSIALAAPPTSRAERLRTERRPLVATTAGCRVGRYFGGAGGFGIRCGGLRRGPRRRRRCTSAQM